MSFTRFLPKFIKNSITDTNHDEHTAVLGALLEALDGTSIDVKNYPNELKIPTSTGVWLDEWGKWFNVSRRSGELDTNYSSRVAGSISQLKSTVPGIKSLLASFISAETGETFTADDIIIYEPYVQLMRYSDYGKFDGLHRMTDGTYWRRNVVAVTLPDGVTLTPLIIHFANTIRAAGIRLWFLDPSTYMVITEETELTPESKEYIRSAFSAGDAELFTISGDRAYGKASGAKQFENFPDEFPYDPLFLYEMEGMAWDDIDALDMTWDQWENKKFRTPTADGISFAEIDAHNFTWGEIETQQWT